MIKKSDENLEAAKQLLGKGLTNAAASRAYYSAYHACWWVLQDVVPPDKRRGGNSYWSHEKIAMQACIHGPSTFDSALRDEYVNFLLPERNIADYDEENVSIEDVKDCISLADKIRSAVKNDTI